MPQPPTRVIVIGAGWSGLMAATTYLKISSLLNRPIDITILDDGDSLGGVWAKERFYPGLTANSPNGLFECSHLSMVSEEHPFAELLPATRVQEYLEELARRGGFLDRLRFGVRVKRCRRMEKGTGKGWIVEAEGGETWECDKLIVASGLYSKAMVPEIKQDSFKGVSIHSKELGRMQQKLREDASVKNVVVVGGCKSAVEACSLFLPFHNPNKEHKVSWVIRPSERGVPMVVQDLEKSAGLLTFNVTRLFSCLSPSIFWTSGFWYAFFHSGKFLPGMALLNSLWWILSWAVKKDARYQRSENGRKIEPRGQSLFYDLNYVSLVSKTSPFLDYLHRDDDQILKVHRRTPVELTGREMILVDEEGSKSTLPCDAVIWCTGWLPSIDFLEEQDARSLGVPVALAKGDIKTTTDQNLNSLPTSLLKPPSYWAQGLSDGDDVAEMKVVGLFPILRTPARKGYPTGYSGFRLYRQIVPVTSLATGDRSIVFAGLVSNAQTAMCCELTSLWGVAWMEDLLPKESLPKNKAEAERNVELISAWMRRRYGVRGMRDPELVLEIQSFFDEICRDLGVAWERKKRGNKRLWWDFLGRMKDEILEWTLPYTGADYKGIIEEFLESNGHLREAGSE